MFRAVIMAAALCVPVAGTAVAAWFLPTMAVAGIMVAAVAASFVLVLKVVDPSGKRAGQVPAGDGRRAEDSRRALRAGRRVLRRRPGQRRLRSAGRRQPHDEDLAGLGLPLVGGTLVLLVTAVVLSVPATARKRPANA